MSHWSLRRVLLLCLGWVLVASVLVAVSAWMSMRAARAQQPATGDYIVTVSVVVLDGWPLAALLLLPPLVLVAVWLLARRRRPEL